MLINLTIDNRNENINIGENITTVAHLKHEIESKFNIQITMIKYQTQFLLDFQDLKSLGIHENSTITILSQSQNLQPMNQNPSPIPAMIQRIPQFAPQPMQMNQPIKGMNQNTQLIPKPVLNSNTNIITNPNIPKNPQKIEALPQNQNSQMEINPTNPTMNPIISPMNSTNPTNPTMNPIINPMNPTNPTMNHMNPIMNPMNSTMNHMNPFNPMNPNFIYGQPQQFNNQQMDPMNTLNPPIDKFIPQQQMGYQNNYQNTQMNPLFLQNQMTSQQSNKKEGELEDKIKELEKQNKQQKSEIRELKNEIEELKEKYTKQLNSENTRFNEKKEEWEGKIQAEQKELKKQKDKLESENQQLNAKVERLQSDLQEANLNLISKNEDKQLNGINYTQLLDDRNNTIKQQKKDIEDLGNQLHESKTQQANNETQYKNQLTNIQVEYKDKFEKQKQQIEQQDQEQKMNKQMISEISQKLNQLLLEKTNLELNKIQLLQQQKQDQLKINDLQELLNYQQKNNNQMKEALLQKNDNNNQSEYYLELIKNQEQLIQQQKERAEKNKQMQENDIYQKQQFKNLEEQKEKQLKIVKKEKEQILKEQIKEKQGTLEICFLLDVTGSMDHYKDQTQKSVKSTVENVKKETSRTIKWSVVAYQDYEELNKLGGKYQQLKFTQDSQLLMTFVQQLKCHGGDDAAEDLAGGIDQMLSQLEWKADYRLAILITDAPCHGTKFNGEAVNDSYKKEDISEQLDKMIDKNIVFLTIDFTKSTQFMTQKMEEYYKSKNRSNMYIKTNMVAANKESLWQELSKLISSTSLLITHTKNKQTRLKGENQEVGKKEGEKKEVLGALEAMCKIPQDPFQFDKLNPNSNIKCQFDIFRVEIKQERLEKIEELLQIKQSDFNFIKEGQWNCVRTSDPFAKGQMKAVYLMKELQNDHLYVIKTPLKLKPYENIDAAIVDMKGHLISKILMTKFMLEVNQNKDKIGFEIPNIVYSDFLILQEKNQFWIAERFFKGDFVKYNNNFGYINDIDTNINKLAQAFSYYTYQQSNFNYMIVDIQGVGNYFTDPAINSNTGLFDETDMGLPGQGNFMVVFDQYKNKITKILKALGIDDD